MAEKSGRCAGCSSQQSRISCSSCALVAMSSGGIGGRNGGVSPPLTRISISIHRGRYKKLSYRRGTARRAVLIRSCHVSRGTGVRERFQSAKMTFKVIQGHWQWRHSIGYIAFLISLSLQLCLRYVITHFLKLFKEITWLWTYPFCGIHHACTNYNFCVSISTRNFKCPASPIPHIWLRIKLKKQVT